MHTPKECPGQCREDRRLHHQLKGALRRSNFSRAVRYAEECVTPWPEIKEPILARPEQRKWLRLVPIDQTDSKPQRLLGDHADGIGPSPQCYHRVRGTNSR